MSVISDAHRDKHTYSVGLNALKRRYKGVQIRGRHDRRCLLRPGGFELHNIGCRKFIIKVIDASGTLVKTPLRSAIISTQLHTEHWRAKIGEMAYCLPCVEELSALGSSATFNPPFLANKCEERGMHQITGTATSASSTSKRWIHAK